MPAKPFAAILLVIVPSASLLAVEPLRVYRNITRPPCATGIPLSRYQYGVRSPSGIEISRTAILLRRSTRVSDELQLEPRMLVRSEYTDRSSRLPAAIIGGVHIDRSIDLYQLDRAGVRINHCEISEVAIQLYDDGQWVLSLRADQNRRSEDGGPDGYNPNLHIKRNEFFIRMRCFGAFDHPAMREVATTGKPVLVNLEPYSFWVENGEPRYIRQHNWDPLVREHFQDIDRVEIEFYYR